MRNTSTSAFWRYCQDVTDIVAARVCTHEDYEAGFTSKAAQLVADNCGNLYTQWQIHRTPVQAADTICV